MRIPEPGGAGLSAVGDWGAAVAAVLGVLGRTTDATVWETEGVEATASERGASFGMGGEDVVFLFTGNRFPVNGRITAVVAAVEAMWFAAEDSALAAWCESLSVGLSDGGLVHAVYEGQSDADVGGGVAGDVGQEQPQD